MNLYTTKQVRKLLSLIQTEITDNRTMESNCYDIGSRFNLKDVRNITDFERGYHFGKLAAFKYSRQFIDKYIRCTDEYISKFKDRELENSNSDKNNIGEHLSSDMKASNTGNAETKVRVKVKVRKHTNNNSKKK